MLVSKRLREEAEKQAHRREQTSQAAHKKWDKERMQTHVSDLVLMARAVTVAPATQRVVMPRRETTVFQARGRG